MVANRNLQAAEGKLRQRVNDGEKKFLRNGGRIISYFKQSASSTNKNILSVRYNFSYYGVNPLSSVEAVTKLWLYSKDRKNHLAKTKKYIHQKMHFLPNFQLVNEPTDIDITELRLNNEEFNKHNSENFNEDLLEGDRIVTTTVRNNANPVINFVLALSGRRETFTTFLQNFENTFLSNLDEVNLWLSYFPRITNPKNSLLKQKEESANEVDFILSMMKQLQIRYPERKIDVIFMKQGAEFSRGIGLQEASKRITNNNEIIFFCDIDLVFTREILLRIRRNTVQGQRVYYPVFFSQYDPEVVYFEKPRPTTHFNFEEPDGFWRSFSYGMFSIYKSDFIRTRGFDFWIKGWGLEDYNMVQTKK